MGIRIGNNNKIKNSNMGESIIIKSENKKQRFNEKHPYITGFLISVLAGLVMLFSFWNKIVAWMEGLF